MIALIKNKVTAMLESVEQTYEDFNKFVSLPSNQSIHYRKLPPKHYHGAHYSFRAPASRTHKRLAPFRATFPKNISQYT